MVKVAKNPKGLIEILKGSLISILFTVILLSVFSAVLTYSNINDKTMPTVIIIITAFSILLGSQITTRKIRKKGIFNGALVGVIYILMLYIISSIVTENFTLSGYAIIMIATSIILGGLGGIIGVNTRNN